MWYKEIIDLIEWAKTLKLTLDRIKKSVWKSVFMWTNLTESVLSNI